MKRLLVTWEVTEVHKRIIEVEDDFDPEMDVDEVAEFEDSYSYCATTDRSVIEVQEVKG